VDNLTKASALLDELTAGQTADKSSPA